MCVCVCVFIVDKLPFRLLSPFSEIFFLFLSNTLSFFILAFLYFQQEELTNSRYLSNKYTFTMGGVPDQLKTVLSEIDNVC